MKDGREKILFIPIEQLNLSQNCIINLKNMQIGKLQDVVDIGWQGLREKQGFDYIYFNEVVRFLTDNGIVHLMERLN